MNTNLPFQYLDFLPSIPDDLLIDFFVKSQQNFRLDEYYRYGITLQLQEWLAVNISAVDNRVGCQVMNSDIYPHCDFRKWAINYILDTGGSNVITTFYKKEGKDLVGEPRSIATDIDELETVLSIQIEPKKWHLLHTNILHGVTGITHSRYAVTIGLISENPFEDIKISFK